MFGRGSPRCPRCGEAVYPAESVQAAGRQWHSACYCCKNCKKGLGPTTQTEKDGEVYCQNCYARLFGPKGYGIGGATTVTGVSVSDSATTCTACGAKDQTGKFCASCGEVRGVAAATTSSSSSGVSNASNIKPVASAPVSSSPYSIVKSAPATTTKILGGSDRCGRCGETVFHAERVTGAGQTWHESCFTCEVCKTRLDSSTLQDKDGHIFCKTDYAKKFGPKGYGFGGGGATTMAYTK